ncbi:hypothetical protein JVX91_05055 [Pseudomonas sp. PDNC002]|uniref:hypothetical protein n=1 Tax=Pseudomonas sp. PDNC002 TaxID=2811422 RepID=UPI0019663494|nr:hypothetical protein [Pseudomonas sp. PDNC002]QRY80488.1 hypothetical protein JVX91_05055 [Pseudomonas sp. PDNC002]
MIKFTPDIDAELIPGVSAAGFVIGESLAAVKERIGSFECYGPDVHLRDILLSSSGWIGTKRRIGLDDQFVFSYRYMNELVSLYFEDREILYRIAVGVGYRGSFHGVRPADSILKLAESFDVDFNSDEDEFIAMKGGKDIFGISFVTDHRASLEHAPEQTIQFISIHDWSLR